MNYYEVIFKCTSTLGKDVAYDVLAAELGEIGFESFTEQEDELSAYIAEGMYDEKKLTDLLGSFPLTDTRFDYTSTLIAGKDWNEEWGKIISNRSGSDRNVLFMLLSMNRNPDTPMIL